MCIDYHRKYRANLDPEKKELIREQKCIRNKRYRDKKAKHSTEITNTCTPNRASTRSRASKEEELQLERERLGVNTKITNFKLRAA